MVNCSRKIPIYVLGSFFASASNGYYGSLTGSRR